MTESTERPRQVTLAAWTIMVGSVFCVLLVFETLSNLHTLQTREAVERFLAEPPGSGLGLTVEGALNLLRTLSMVTAGCATAAAILGYHVLRRNRAARIALTVLAVPLLLAGLATGGFLSSLVAACAFLLWLPPARDWYEGRDWKRPTPPSRSASSAFAPPSHHAGPSAPTPPGPPGSSGSTGSVPNSGPRAVSGFGSTPTADPFAQPGAPGRQATSPWASGGPVSSRPSPVVWACALTWLFSGLGAVALVVGMVVFAGDHENFIAEVREQNPELVDSGVTDQMLLVATLVMGSALVVWALAAMALAYLLFRGVSWSRIVLIVSTLGALALLGIGTLSQVALIVPFLAAAMTMTLLLRPETISWVKSPRRRDPG